MKKILKALCVSTFVAGLLASAALPAYGAESGSAKGGASKLLSLSQIKTPVEAEALKPGDAIAMVCSKCKSVSVEYITQDSKHLAKMVVGEKHLCPGCRSTIEVVGHGKNKTEVVRHVCKECGDESAFCCATSKNGKPTPGMEKH